MAIRASDSAPGLAPVRRRPVRARVVWGTILWLFGFFQDARAEPDRVVFLSALTSAQDSTELAQFGHKLMDAGFGPAKVTLIHREVAPEGSSLQSDIRQLFSEGPVRLVVAKTMAIARGVQLVDSTQKVIFSGAGDPVRMCLVKSLQRPGKSATGVTTAWPGSGKMLETLNDAYPYLALWVVVVDGTQSEDSECNADGTTARHALPSMCEAGLMVQAPRWDDDETAPSLRQVAARYRKPLQFYKVCSDRDFMALAKYAQSSPPAGVVVFMQRLTYENRRLLIDALNKARLPTVYDRALFVELGGLMSVAPSPPLVPMAPAFDLAIRVLRGAPPSTLPVQVPSGFSVLINLRAAKLIGRPPTFFMLTRADRFLE